VPGPWRRSGGSGRGRDCTGNSHTPPHDGTARCPTHNSARLSMCTRPLQRTPLHTQPAQHSSFIGWPHAHTAACTFPADFPSLVSVFLRDSSGPRKNEEEVGASVLIIQRTPKRAGVTAIVPCKFARVDTEQKRVVTARTHHLLLIGTSVTRTATGKGGGRSSKIKENWPQCANFPLSNTHVALSACGHAFGSSGRRATWRSCFATSRKTPICAKRSSFT